LYDKPAVGAERLMAGALEDLFRPNTSPLPDEKIGEVLDAGHRFFSFREGLFMIESVVEY